MVESSGNFSIAGWRVDVDEVNDGETFVDDRWEVEAELVIEL
jgi:hypothetical protein